jgi:hypothetical protein
MFLDRSVAVLVLRTRSNRVTIITKLYNPSCDVALIGRVDPIRSPPSTYIRPSKSPIPHYSASDRMDVSRIFHLAQVINSQTSVLETCLRSHRLPEPSFTSNSPVEPFAAESSSILEAKKDVIEAAIELRQLLEGPVKLLLPEVNSPHCSGCGKLSVHHVLTICLLPSRISFPSQLSTGLRWPHSSLSLVLSLLLIWQRKPASWKTTSNVSSATRPFTTAYSASQRKVS